jgi:hypothetical protein
MILRPAMILLPAMILRPAMILLPAMILRPERWLLPAGPLVRVLAARRLAL